MTDQALQRMDSAPPAIVSDSAAILSVIARAASDPSVDVAKMERLMAMQERVLARQSEAAFAGAMEQAQSEMPLIKNDSRNQQTNSTYAKLKTVNQLVVPIYTKHGFSLSFGTADSPLADHVRITCKVRHVAGHTADYQCDVPLDTLGPKGLPNKTRTHGFGSSLSYGRRYLTMLIFNVATTDDDDGQKAGSPATQKSVTELKKDLWYLLAKVRGPGSDWSGANQWLWDNVCMEDNKRVEGLDANALAEVLAKAKRKLDGRSQ